MCSVILLKNKDAEYPLAIFQNRNEMKNRPFSKPAKYWDDKNIIGARDDLSDGSWVGINKSGICATILNKSGYINYDFGSININKIKKGRGKLIPQILQAKNIKESLQILMYQNLDSLMPFYLVISDKNKTYCADFDGVSLSVVEIKDKINLITSSGVNSSSCRRYIRFYDNIKEMSKISLIKDDLQLWKELMSIKSQNHPSDGMFIDKKNEIKTTSSSIILLHQELNNNLFFFSEEEPILNKFKEYYQCKKN